MAKSMFGSDSDRKNDRYGWIDAAAPELLRASRELVENNEASRVSDEAVTQILTAAIRLYVAKSDGEERTFSPIADRRPARQRDDAGRAVVGGVRDASRAASRPNGTRSGR